MTSVDCILRVIAAAIVANTIFCVHGGLSPDLNNMDQVYIAIDASSLQCLPHDTSNVYCNTRPV